MHTVNKQYPVLLLVIALFAFGFVSTSAAETTNNETVRYITDKLFVPLRADQSEESGTVNAGLPSGTALKILEENKASGYSKVETRNGQQGWLRTRYLVSEPTAASKLATLEKKVNETGSKNDSELQKNVDTLTDQNNKLTEQNTALQKQLNEIRMASANVIKMNDQNKELIEKNQLLQSKVNSLEAVSDKFKQNSDTSLFIYGGILVILTLLVSAWLDGVKRKRSYNNWG